MTKEAVPQQAIGKQKTNILLLIIYMVELTMEHKQITTSFTTEEAKQFHLQQLKKRLLKAKPESLKKELFQGIQKFDAAIRQAFEQNFAKNPKSANQITRALDDYPAAAYLPDRLWQHLQIDNFKRAVAYGQTDEWFYQQCQYSYDFLFDKDGNFTEEALTHLPQLRAILENIKDQKILEAFKRDFFMAVTVNPMINLLNVTLYHEKETVSGKKNYEALMRIQTKAGKLRERFVTQDIHSSFKKQFEKLQQETQTKSLAIKDKWLIAIEKLQLYLGKLEQLELTMLNEIKLLNAEMEATSKKSNKSLNISSDPRLEILKLELKLIPDLKSSANEARNAIEKHLAKELCFADTNSNCQREIDALNRRIETLVSSNQLNKSWMFGWLSSNKKSAPTQAETALRKTLQDITNTQKTLGANKENEVKLHGSNDSNTLKF